MIKKISAEGLLLLVLLIMGSLQNVVAQEFEHTLWDRLLKRHVLVVDGGSATAVDYLGMLKDRAQLQSYLDTLSTLSQQDFDRMNAASQLALLINVYNAATVDLILSIYPDIESIKDLGGFFSSPWKKEFINLLGEKYSLDDIEHKMIRGCGRYNDPRIHFALNCASISCPALRAQAYQGDQLNAQLEQRTHLFLSNSNLNRSAARRLKLSSIFKWYREDFEKGWQGINSLNEFLVVYSDAMKLSPDLIQGLKNNDIEIDFMDYDWGLNAKN